MDLVQLRSRKKKRREKQKQLSLLIHLLLSPSLLEIIQKRTKAAEMK
jgi:hypothetical protein